MTQQLPQGKPEPEPSQELLQEAHQWVTEDAMIEFAQELEHAILVARRYPALVKLGTLPEDLHAAYVKHYKYEPFTHLCLNDEYKRKGFSRWAKLKAKRLAIEWARRRALEQLKESHHLQDRAFLREMGIDGEGAVQ